MVVESALDTERIEEMDRELTVVIEDFDRAVDVESLRLAKRSGTLSLFQYSDSSFSLILCRARFFAPAAQVRRDQLSPEPPLYGGHAPISPQTNTSLGNQ